MSGTEKPMVTLTRKTRSRGQPHKLTEEETKEVLLAFEDYINTEDDPTIVGFCAWNATAIQYRVNKDNIHDWSDFSELRKRAIEKQEAQLLKAAGNGKYNAVVAIFRLKQPQHGYKDRVEQDITSDGKSIAPQPADTNLVMNFLETVAKNTKR